MTSKLHIEGSTLRWKDDQGKLHRDHDKPAVVLADGDMFWYQHGRLHRDNNEPAVIYADGTKSWYQHGKLIRRGIPQPVNHISRANLGEK